MVYLDGSEGSILAMRLAVVLADFMGAELYALSIVNTRALSDLVPRGGTGGVPKGAF
jgi:nucleotide-binding universal stress UspA family protein